MPSPETLAKEAGERAALAHVPYCANPYPARRPTLRLAWSEGHNIARATRAFFTYKAPSPTYDPPPALGWTVAEWHSFSPGMRREITKIMETT